MEQDVTDDKDCPIRIRHLEDVLENDTSEFDRKQKERPLRYEHLERDQYQVVDALLRGGVNLDSLPCQQPKVVRLFVCSSGQDFEAERNYLAENVYPLVRQYCRDNHGVDFQMVDMYWGTSDMPCDDPYKMAAVHNELRYCQKTSMGPSFVLFIGQKYGNIRLPLEIVCDEMDAIIATLRGNGRDPSLIEDWYRKDTNVKPNVYRLRKDGDFRQIHEDIVDLLRIGATKALNGAEAQKYHVSDFEDMIQSGLLKISKEAAETNCAIFMRDIKNINEHLHAKNATCFVDLIGDTCVLDEEKAEKINSLKHQIEQTVPESNILKSVIQLNGCTLDESKSSDYINTVGQQFYKFVTNTVEQLTLGDRTNCICHDELCHEVALHWRRAREAGFQFYGRDDILNAIKGYILSETDHPLVIYGKSGCGKTSLIAKAANDINEAILNGHLSMPTALITRFMCETGVSQDIQPFLFNICHQLTYVMGKYRQDIPREFKSLKNYFIDIVQRGEYGGMVVILIDSLDRLTEINEGAKLTWLPPRLAENIKIIVTIDEDSDDMIQRFRNKMDIGMIRMPHFSSDSCENLIKISMSEKKQTVNYNQWKTIHNAFNITSSPLFATMSYIELSKWRSYDNVSLNRLEHSVKDFAGFVLDRLEKRHGKYIVEKVLGYFTASQNGLSESELEDILSLDNTLLNGIFVQRNQYPNIHRFPVACWVQIRQDIEPYLLQRVVDGVAILSWRYKSFADITRHRYCADDSDATLEIYSNLSDYFLGTWSGTKRKPFRHPTVLMAKYKLVEMEDESCRYVLKQPFRFGSSEVYNKRKMSQLPYYLQKSKRSEELKSALLCDYEYLMCKIKVFSLEQVLADFSQYSDRETRLVGEALRMSKSAILLNPQALGMEITGRLLSHIGKCRSIRELIRQCDLNAQRSCPLVPNCQIYTAPGGPLEYECDVGGSKSCPIDIDVFSSPDTILLIAKPYYSSRLRVWELKHGEERPDIMLPIGEVRPSKDGKYINIFVENTTIKIFRSDCGVQHGEVEYGMGNVADCDVSTKYIAFGTQKGAGPYVIDIERCELLHKFTYHTHAVAISDGENFLAFNSERNILLYELPLMTRQCVAKATDVSHDILFIDESPKCYVMTKSKLIEAITFNIINRKFTCKTILTDLEAKECIQSNSKRRMIVRCRKTLHIIDTKLDKVCTSIQKLPPGMFMDSSSVFSGAGFTPNDRMIVATRYTYLIVWDAETFEPIRVLQSAISPMTKVFTSDSVNKVVSLLENNSFQVWNLDNIDQDILHAVEIHNGAVKSLALTSSSPYIISHDDVSPDAKLVSVGSGKVLDTFQHTDNERDRIVAVKLSPNGSYAVTRAKTGHRFSSFEDNKFEALTDDILWEVETASKVFHAMTNRYTMFGPDSDVVGFVTCSFYNRHDWSDNIYNVFIVNPENSSNRTIDFPYNTEFVSEPCIIKKNKVNYFVAVIQSCKKTFDSKTNKELSRWSEIRLFIQKLSICQTPDDQDLLRVTNLAEHLDVLDQFIDVKPVSDNNIVAIYVRNLKQYEFELDKGIVHPKNKEKGAFVYDVCSNAVLKHITSFLHPTTCLDTLKFSTNHSVVIDEAFQVFSGDTFTFLRQIKQDNDLLRKSGRFALDGAYIIAISANRRNIVVFRTSDGHELGSVFVHGRAECLEVSNDGRTVVAGCQDGRVMIFSLILGFSDPLREYIEYLPSRSETLSEEENDLINVDVRHISNSTPDHHRLSARIRRKSISQERRPPSYTTLHRAVTVSRQSNRQRGTNACIQQ